MTGNRHVAKTSAITVMKGARVKNSSVEKTRYARNGSAANEKTKQNSYVAKNGCVCLDPIKLLAKRTEKGFTLQKMAEKVGKILGKSTTERAIWRAGKGRPIYITTADGIAQALGCDLKDILLHTNVREAASGTGDPADVNTIHTEALIKSFQEFSCAVELYEALAPGFRNEGNERFGRAVEERIKRLRSQGSALQCQIIDHLIISSTGDNGLAEGDGSRERNVSSSSYNRQRHLMDVLLDVGLVSTKVTAIDLALQWLPQISTQIDAYQSTINHSYLDRSAKRPERILKKIRDLVDLDRLLQRDEQEVLAASAFVRTLRLAASRPVSPDWTLFGTLAEHIKHTVVFMETKSRRRQALLAHPRRVRYDFIAALLTLGETLDGDNNAIHPASIEPPIPEAHLSVWIAYLTKCINVQSRGIVTFNLAVPSSEWIESLKLCTAARFELLWQQHRRVLTGHNVAIAAAPSIVTVGDKFTPPPPESVLRRLKLVGDRLRRQLPTIAHLGGVKTTCNIEDLLPLPESNVIGPLTFYIQHELPQKLVVVEDGDTISAAQRLDFIIPAGVTEPLVIQLPDSTEAIAYRWTLYRMYDEESPALPVANGNARTLGVRERTLWTFWGHTLAGRDRSFLQVELDLRSDFLVWLWPFLKNGTAQMEDRIIAVRFIYSAYEWIRLNAPRSRQLELYSRSVAWLQTLLQK